MRPAGGPRAASRSAVPVALCPPRPGYRRTVDVDVAQRCRFVFGSAVDASTWEAARDAVRRGLVEKRFGEVGEAQLHVRLGVVEQLISGEPPEVWTTAQRLVSGGVDVDRVVNQMAMVLLQSVADVLDEGQFDEHAYKAHLERLPLPAPEEIERALLDVAAASVVLPTDDLVARTAERLGFDHDDPVVVRLIEHVEEQLTDGLGPLVWLPGGRTAHTGALREGIVLTHVLTESEKAIGALTVAFDLAGFGGVGKPSIDGAPVEPVSAERGHLAWWGPDGWLDRFEVATILAVRVGPDGAIDLRPLPEAPAVDPELVTAVRQVYDKAVAEPQVPVSGQDLVFGLLATDRALLAPAHAPLRALCEAAGLEVRASSVAHDPEIWRNEMMIRRVSRVLAEADDDNDLAERVLGVLDLTDQLALGGDVDAASTWQVLEDLADPEVLELATDELFDVDDPSELVHALASHLVEAAQRPGHRATARLIAAHAAETAGDWAAAEQHLELAVKADPSNVHAVDRLAWYVGDRGDAERATRLWRTCPRSASGQDLETLGALPRPAPSGLGRNDPCWCRSGRKHKHCHLGAAEPVPLPERVGWLCRKAVGYLERIGPTARVAIVDVARSRAPDPEKVALVIDDPLVLDLVLTEGGWSEQFLADRGHLLPDDEALLATMWTTVERTVYEVTATTPGTGLTVRDLRTGDHLDVRERTFSRTARTGMLVCARAVPDGETHQFIGGIFPVAPGTETTLLDLLDERDPHLVASWARDLHRPPELRTRESEPLVECEIVATTDDPAGLTDHLGTTYDSDTPGQWWTEHHDLDDQSVIRARFHLDGNRLTITTNSNERADRILQRLDGAAPVTIVSDTRTPFDATTVDRTRRAGLPDLHGLDTGPEPAPPDKAVAEIQRHFEQRWCNEAIPALGGLTPMQAAADPTRREQLERLLASFDALDTPRGAITMRTDHLRKTLGL